MNNLDQDTVSSFGDEWARYDQQCLDEAERRSRFEAYFRMFPWSSLPESAQGFDMGCGSGRWAELVAPRVAKLFCIDPAMPALEVARRRMAHMRNVEFVHAGVGDEPLAEDSQDFGFSLGVLHHVPDTAAALRSCVRMLKPGAPFLLYLYYRFDNRPGWYQLVWQGSDLLRRAISRIPQVAKTVATEILSVLVYLPMARLARHGEKLGFRVDNWPLSNYRSASLYTMRTDSRDRFGTPLEHRFTRDEIAAMMRAAGLHAISFSDHEPYWCAIGYKEPS